MSRHRKQTHMKVWQSFLRWMPFLTQQQPTCVEQGVAIRAEVSNPCHCGSLSCFRCFVDSTHQIEITELATPNLIKFSRGLSLTHLLQSGMLKLENISMWDSEPQESGLETSEVPGGADGGGVKDLDQEHRMGQMRVEVGVGNSLFPSTFWCYSQGNLKWRPSDRMFTFSNSCATTFQSKIILC